MRRTSCTVFGLACIEWLECTMSSDSASSRCALEYCTTPSSPVSTGPSVSTPTIELTAIPWRDRDRRQRLDERVARRHVVEARGNALERERRGPVACRPVRSVLRSTTSFGRRIMRAASRRRNCGFARKLPRCGVAMKTTRLHERQRRHEQRLGQRLARAVPRSSRSRRGCPRRSSRSGRPNRSRSSW